VEFFFKILNALSNAAEEQSKAMNVVHNTNTQKNNSNPKQKQTACQTHKERERERALNVVHNTNTHKNNSNPTQKQTACQTHTERKRERERERGQSQLESISIWSGTVGVWTEGQRMQTISSSSSYHNFDAWL
jgi:hypothetical protein